jgi:ATP-binding cassette subfamily B protein
MLKLLRLIAAFRGGVTAVVALALAQSLANLALPRFMAEIVDQGIVPGDTRRIVVLGGWMLVVTLLSTACAVASAYHAARIATGFGRLVRTRIFERVTHLSLHQCERFSTASLVTRTTNDATQVQQVLIMLLSMVVTSPMMMVGGVVMALSQDVTLAWLLFAVIPVMGVVFALIMGRSIPLYQVMQAKIDRLNLVLDEGLTGVRVIRAFDRDRHEQQRFDAANRDLTDTAISVNRLVGALMPALFFTMNLTGVAIIWVGGGQVQEGAMPVGAMIASLQYAMQILFSVFMVAAVFAMLPRASASAARINEVLDTEPEIVDPVQPRAAGGERGVVEFRNVTFQYPGAEEPALLGVSFTARPGEVTAVVGGTGAGKSTLVGLIPRFYDANQGQVLVGGVDVRELRQEDLRARIGFVPQKTVLFSGTIGHNLRFGRTDAGEADVSRAVSVAQAAEFIARTEEGYDHVVAQGGTNLSGGQKQRLAIARALVRRPDVFIFDDSFSALDFATDARLRAALGPETREAAVFIVSQRVGTVMHADRILVLDEGRVVGLGRHDELLERCEVYREIVASQVSQEDVA